MKTSKALLVCLCIVLLGNGFSSAIELKGKWYFKAGDDPAWSAPDFDHSAWDQVNVTGGWEKNGMPDYDGVGWYRKTFMVPAEYAGKRTTIIIGPVDDQDNTFINGIQVGTTRHWATRRKYFLDTNILKPGKENIIALRAQDWTGAGGLMNEDTLIVPSTFDIFLPFKVAYKALPDGKTGQISCVFENLSTTAISDITVTYKILNYFSNEVASGKESLSVAGKKRTEKKFTVEQGNNRDFTILLTLSHKDIDTYECYKRVRTGIKDTTASTDHVWLHVEGKYIKTSPYADPPNQIFKPVGDAWIDAWGDNIVQDPDLYWANGCNLVRYVFISLPYPQSNPHGLREKTGKSIEQIIDDYIAPTVNACKERGMYTYIDQHTHMNRYTDKDQWFPPMTITWNKQEFQLWIDHWVTIAKHFKDEPWVMGYELCNEPIGIMPGQCRKEYLKCVKAVRAVDKRHILVLASNFWTHAASLEATWAPIKFKPDEPYNQVVFSWHEYTHSDDIYTAPPGKQPVNTIVERIQKKYDVPLFCTEFGDVILPNVITNEKETRQHQIDVIKSCNDHNMGWTIWSGRDDDIWIPRAHEYGSSIPLPGNRKPEASRIRVSAPVENVPFNSTAVITAELCDEYGWPVSNADNDITFEISYKKADGTVLEGPASVKAANGTAAINLKAGTAKGVVTITAKADGIDQGETLLEITKK